MARSLDIELRGQLNRVFADAAYFLQSLIDFGIFGFSLFFLFIYDGEQ